MTTNMPDVTFIAKIKCRLFAKTLDEINFGDKMIELMEENIGETEYNLTIIYKQ